VQNITVFCLLVKMWNDLPADTTDFSSLNSFKVALNSKYLAEYSTVYLLDVIRSLCHRLWILTCYFRLHFYCGMLVASLFCHMIWYINKSSYLLENLTSI